MSPVRRRLALVAALPALGLGLAACGQFIQESALEDQVTSTLESEFGPVSEVDCPEDLEAEVDATTECTATVSESGEELRLRLTVTSVEDDQAQFDIERIE